MLREGREGDVGERLISAVADPVRGVRQGTVDVMPGRTPTHTAPPWL